MFHRPQLDSDSGVPLYRQLYEHIKDDIRMGRLMDGDRLPASRELAEQIGLNRTTITAAYRLLESDGLIRRYVGRGSFVAPQDQSDPQSLPWRELLSATGPMDPGPRLPAASGAPDLISFATSRPSEDFFPMDTFRAVTTEVLASRDASDILQLGSPSGYEPLRRYLMGLAAKLEVARESDDIVITSGCQQALDLLVRVLIGRDDTVLVEDPVYPGVHHVLARAGARLVSVPVGRNGVEPDRLGQLIEHTRPKAVVLTPNFQNPTGATLPYQARQAIIRMVKAAGVVLIENDIYADLRYHGAPLPTLKQLDRSGDVVQLGSFSKIAFPGLRVGWIIGPRALIARVTEAKQWSDLHTDQLAQAVLLRFAESGALAAHRKQVVAAGSQRLSATLAACERHLPQGSRVSRPEGGMNLWIDLPEALDTSEMLPRAHHEGVSYLPGRYFSVSSPHSSSLRLSFAGLAPDSIRTGIARLGTVFRSELERVQQAARPEPAPAIV